MAYGLQNAPQGIQPYSSITGGSWVDKLNQYYINPAFNDARFSATGFPSYFNGDPVNFSEKAPSAAAPITGTVTPFLMGFADGAPSLFEDIAVLGAFVSCEYYDVTGKYIVDNKFIGGTPTYIDASGNQSLVKAFVSDDPQIVYDVQISTHINNVGDGTVAGFTSPPIFPNVNIHEPLMGGVGSNFALAVGNGAAPPLATTGFNNVTIPGQGIKYANNPATGNSVSGQSAFYLDVSTYVGGDATHDYSKTVANLPLKVVGIASLNQVLPITDGVAYTLATTPFINVLSIINNHEYGHGSGQLGRTLV